MGQVQREPSIEGWLAGVDERLANLERLATLGGSLYGPVTATVGTLKSGEEKTVTVAHGIGRTPIAVLGGLQDGFFSAELSWRWEANATNVSITFHNLGSHEDTASLKFVCVA